MENRRQMLGLKGIRGATASGVDTTADGTFAWVLGFAFGLQYDSKKPGACYTALSGSIFEYESILLMLQLIYVPTYWADLLGAGQN